jgi:hypothetical protein
MKKLINYSIITAALLLSSTLKADLMTYKSILKDNNSLEYRHTPLYASSIDEMFRKGIFLGRLRSNYFEYIDSSGDNVNSFGMGASVKYRTAKLSNIYFEGQMDISVNPISSFNPDNPIDAKAGKDVYSVKNVLRDNGEYNGYYAIPELNVNYKNSFLDLQAGYFGFNSAFTAENNTKMIKNSFMGLNGSMKNKQNIYKTAVLREQKLRNHQDYHDVIRYDSLNGNDDSGTHRGLSKTNGLEEGSVLYINELETMWIPKTKILVSNATINDLFTSSILNIEYFMNMSGYNVLLGFRYYNQTDLGAGKIGGSSISGDNSKGMYTNPNSVNADMYAGKIEFISNDSRFLIGYSAVSDKADIISPWRNFPTKGYTRSMGQLNWYANTKSLMVQLKTKLDDYGIVTLDYSKIDVDNKKVDRNNNYLSDYDVYHIEYTFNNFSSIKNLQLKTRYSYINDVEKYYNKDRSYQDIRTEFNFVF